MVQLAEDRNTYGRELRACVVETLQELMKTDDKVVALEADLGGASGFTKIQASNPDRFVQCGIAEANMVGVAAGLSVTGYKPFLHTFGPFATRRVFDQLFLSGGYAGTTINVYGSDPGFSVAANGGTHTTWEDVALMRQIPGSIICDAADDVQLSWIIREFSNLKGIHYVRANRKAVRNVYAEGTKFEIGKGKVLKTGSDVLVIASGQLISDVLDMAEAFAKENVSVEVIDPVSIKPFDKQLLLQEAKDKKLIVTVENHSIYGGIGSTVAEIVAEENVGIPVKRIGVDERFGQVGTAQYLQKEFGLTAKQMKESIEAAL